jgi:protein-disulfide isomerase
MHPHARVAALAVRCAGDQGKYWEMRHVVQVNASSLSREKLIALARDVGLDVNLFSGCLIAEPHKAAIEQDMAAGSQAGVTGTPTFVIGHTAPDAIEGPRIVGAQPYAIFDGKLKELLSAPKP